MRGWNRTRRWRPNECPPKLLGIGGQREQSQTGEELASATVTDDAKTIAELSRLPPLEYDRARKLAAKALAVRPETLDKMVAEKRKAGGDDEMEFPDVEPWPHPVDPAALLTGISNTVRRYIVCDRETTDAAALWAALTWLIDAV